ncbi:DMT family transporter [Pelagibacteraceae bacterium]|jgi:drug/metabolite transporter (DMT)-like permease|nr:DMT family transporter [Pelagibacteraceae bacterium]
MNKKLFSFVCAISCSFIWGSAFVAQDMGMDYIGPFTFTGVRMVIAFISLLPFFFIYEFKKIKKNKINFNIIFSYICLLGFLLSVGMSLQQFALLRTDVANTAVFTILYVVLVPFVAYFLFSKNIHWSIWPSVLMCLLGGFLLTEFDDVTIRAGDTLSVINAFFWAFHIVFISKFLRIFNYPVTIATFQCLVGAVVALVPAYVFEEIVFSNILLEYQELLYVGVLSSGIAFLLQIYAQQNLSPAPVAIILSLEGAIAAIFGWILLDQFLNEVKILGILVILIAVIFAQIVPLRDNQSKFLS